MTQDEDVCTRLRSGATSAVEELLTRDHSVAYFVARAMGDDARADAAVSAAWSALMSDVCAGVVVERLRFQLLLRLCNAIPRTVQVGTQEARPVRIGSFNARGHAWEGWWDEEPPAWPNGAAPTPDQVLGALRRLPFLERAVLVLHDVAGLAASEVAVIVDAEGREERLLESARDDYLAAIDREVLCVP